VTGRENLPTGRAAVYCGNHESNVDAPILFFVLHPRLHMLYKAEFGKVPILGRAIRHARCVPVYREDRDRSIRWLEEAVPMLRAGTSFLFYPEGTRSEPGTLLPFKKGGFIMAIQAQVPVVPVATHGAYGAMKRGSWLIHPVTVSVRIGEPIETAGLTVNDRDVIVDKVRARMEEMLALGPM
jgi:1-acyl-sn-glycerol-3-phosphate acyltransferase